jgi:hypothetical protein
MRIFAGMSKHPITENSALVDRVYEAFMGGDVDAIVSAFAEDGVVEFAGASALVPWHLPARGRAELPRFFAVFAQEVEIQRFERVATVAAMDAVVSRVKMSYRVRATGRTIDEEQVHWWTIAEGRIVAMTHFEDTAQVIAAVRAPR